MYKYCVSEVSVTDYRRAIVFLVVVVEYLFSILIDAIPDANPERVSYDTRERFPVTRLPLYVNNMRQLSQEDGETKNLKRGNSAGIITRDFNE